MMNIELEPKGGFIDYNFFMFCSNCRTRCIKGGGWKKNRCKICHNKMRVTSHDKKNNVKYIE